MVGVLEIALRDHLEQACLDFQRRLAGGEAQAMRHPEHVRIHGQCGLAEGRVEHNVGGLAAHSGKRLQCLALARHLAAVLGNERPGQADDVLGLVAMEPDGLDAFLQARFAQLEHLLRRVGYLEERLGGFVDTSVGGLGRQDDGHEQRKGIGIYELALGLGIGRGKAPENLGHPLGRRPCPPAGRGALRCRCGRSRSEGLGHWSFARAIHVVRIES
jgi:hypothetical protein